MLKSIRTGLVLVLVSIVFIDALPVENEESALDLILLHNNDLHGRFAETTIDGPDCRPEDSFANKCYGGFARISTLVKRYRSDQEKDGLPVLFLNAGDTYVGTPWFQLFKDKITVDFMNALKPDVGALGNHEFDFGIKGLVPFLANINFPIAVANLNISTNHPLWQTHALERSVVFNIKGFKVGVIGYITDDLHTLSTPEDVGVLPEIGAINEESDKLRKQGVNIIIALGHSGYEKDQEIAKECPLVDLVVGAHSHTFLYTGIPPDPKDVPLGPYPTVIVQKSGKKVPVVQAYAWSKYLGKLQLSV
ncbi:protein 5NUC-like, partial [Sitodiplosis mosellana]|uniref:protein 5NUC-like n=1 Tax=Sitodiplosis mosellana TaxID=263140 RepID=UPI002444195C